MLNAFPAALKIRVPVVRLPGHDQYQGFVPSTSVTDYSGPLCQVRASALQLSRETGVRQQNLSRWLEQARNLPRVASASIKGRQQSVEHKARMLAQAASQLRSILMHGDRV